MHRMESRCIQHVHVRHEVIEASVTIISTISCFTAKTALSAKTSWRHSFAVTVAVLLETSCTSVSDQRSTIDDVTTTTGYHWYTLPLTSACLHHFWHLYHYIYDISSWLLNVCRGARQMSTICAKPFDDATRSYRSWIHTRTDTHNADLEFPS